MHSEAKDPPVRATGSLDSRCPFETGSRRPSPEPQRLSLFASDTLRPRRRDAEWRSTQNVARSWQRLNEARFDRDRPKPGYICFSGEPLELDREL